MENIINNINQNMDIYLLFYLLLGFVLGLFLRKMVKLFFTVVLLMLLAVIYNHYSITQDDVNQVMGLVNIMIQKVTYLLKYLYNTLTFLKVSAIIIGFLLSLLIT